MVCSPERGGLCPLLALCAGGWLACADLLGFEAAELDPLAASPAAAPLLGAISADAGAAPSLCEEYCDSVLAACGPDVDGTSYAVYDSRFTCLYQCLLFAPGGPGDEMGNSVQCRLNSARVALQFPGERRTACPAAGPGGNGVCGSNCEGYCTLMLAECPNAFDAVAGGLSPVEACAQSCAATPDLGGFDTSRIEGNSLQCRLYHLQAASVSPRNHCGHAAGAYPCGLRLESTSAAPQPQLLP